MTALFFASAAIAWDVVANWFAGIATTAAVVVALYFSRRQEAREEAVRLEEVYAWCIPNPTFNRKSPWLLCIMNHTKNPIYTWTAYMRWMPTVPTSTDNPKPVISRKESRQDTAGIALPGLNQFPWNKNLTIGGLPATNAKIEVVLEFTDARDRQLTRGPYGGIAKGSTHRDFFKQPMRRHPNE